MIYFDTLVIGLMEKGKVSPYIYFKNDTFDGEVKLREHIDMEYSGQEDKNGKEIYEGDIVKGPSPWDRRVKVFGVVRFEQGSFVIDRGETSSVLSPMLSAGDHEIVGNIFENPELIEGLDIDFGVEL